MIIKVFNATNYVQVLNSLARDERLQIDTRGLLVMILSYPATYRLSVEVLLEELNRGSQSEDRIGVKRLRRMTREMTDAGYLKIKAVMDERTQQFIGKEWHINGMSKTAKVPYDPDEFNDHGAIPVLDQTQVVPDGIDEIKSSKIAKKVETGNPKKYPAATIFQEVFDLPLDLETMRYIQSEVGIEQKVWRRTCMDHFAGFTEEQRANNVYRSRALKFCLIDFRKALLDDESATVNKGKTAAGVVTDINHPDYKPPRKTFAQYVQTHGYERDTPVYIKFRSNWVTRALEKGNKEALREVDEYEGLERSLADIKARQGSISQ